MLEFAYGGKAFLPVCHHGSLYRSGILRAVRFPGRLNHQNIGYLVDNQWRDECLQIAAFNSSEKLLAVSAIDRMASQKICEDIGINEHLSRNLHVLLLALPSISQFQRSCW